MTLQRKTVAISSAVMVFLTGMYSDILVYRSTTTMILSNTVPSPALSGRSVIKSMEISSHGPLG